MVQTQKETPRRESKPAPKIPDVAEEPRILSPMIQKTLDINLLKAAKRKEWKRMETLLDAGAKAEEKTTAGFSALTYAASEGQTRLVQKMIDSGVEVSIKNFASRTAFTEAYGGGHKKTADLLLTVGKLGAGNSIIPLPPLTPEQEERVADAIERIVWGE